MDVLNFALSLALFAWLATAVFWGLATFAVAASFSLERAGLWGVLGAVAPILSFLICLIIGLTKNKLRKPTRPTEASKGFKVGFAIACGLLAWLMIFALFLPWFVILGVDGPVYSLRGWASGLDGWLWVTVLTVIAAAIFTVYWPNRLTAVALAWFGSWWLLYALAALTSEAAFRQAVDALFDVTALALKDVDAPILKDDSHWTLVPGGVWVVMAFIGLALLALSVWLLAKCARIKASPRDSSPPSPWNEAVQPLI